MAPGAGIYEALWRVPNGVAAGTELPFQVRIVDAGANVTTADVRLRAAPPRKVYEAAQVAVLPDDTMLGAGGDAQGPVFLLDGTVLSLYPQTSPAVRALPSMYVYAGGVAAGASFTPSASVLTAPEVTSYASSVLYNPLELSVTDVFGLGHGARVDVSARGLLGSTPTQSMVLPGQTGSASRAGGSHGGSGGPGSPNGGWTRTDLTAPGSVYDLVTDPALPGGGGGAAAGPFGSTGAGGTGGGVVRLLAPGAVVHLEGDVLADGGNGPGDGSGGSIIGPGGAGGTIRIVASRLEGAGRLSAAGGRGTHGFYAGGGGGGRIALSFAEPPAAGLPLTLAAPGGFNSLPPDANAQQLGGAGTIYLEELDALGAPKAPGRLLVANAAGKPAWPTPFSGPQRFGSVDARGAARLVFLDTLSVGAVDPPAVNDRASVTLDASARLLLETEAPEIVETATPDGGTVEREPVDHGHVDGVGPDRHRDDHGRVLAAGAGDDRVRGRAARRDAGRAAPRPDRPRRAAAGPDHVHPDRDRPRGPRRDRSEDVDRPRRHNASHHLESPSARRRLVQPRAAGRDRRRCDRHAGIASVDITVDGSTTTKASAPTKSSTRQKASRRRRSCRFTLSPETSQAISPSSTAPSRSSARPRSWRLERSPPTRPSVSRSHLRSRWLSWMRPKIRPRAMRR